MNPFPNPIFLLSVAKSYLSYANWIRYNNKEKLKKYQDKALRKMVKYAYNVPLYKKKYREYGIHPDDIKGIDDIKKLPFITKNDLKEHFPHGIILDGVNTNKFIRINSSGTTGMPFSIFRDLSGLINDEMIGNRCFKFYGYNFKRDRLTIIGPYTTPGRYDYVMYNTIYRNFRKMFLAKNIQYVGYFMREIEEKIEQINKFNPTYLFGFPGDIKVIATYKKNDFVRVSPKCIITSGENLDRNSKKYIEDTFDCRVFDIYTSIEMGTGAFQCEYGNYHINSDFIIFEFLDDEKNPVLSDEPCNVVITRLFGKGTPLIRYTGLEDIVTPLYEKCPCGLETGLIKHIKGREASHIVLPGGKYISLAIIGGVMSSLRYNNILSYQIIQEKIDRIELHVVIDEKKDKNLPAIRLFSELGREYQKIFGPEVEINIKKVKEIRSKSCGPPPVILSKVGSV